MKNLIIFLVLASVVLIPSCKSEAMKEHDKHKVVMAYYLPNEDFNPADLPLDRLTHIILCFTEVIDGKMLFENSLRYDQLRSLTEARDQHPGLKVMVACGGWTGSGGFSDMALTPSSRASFIASVMEMVEAYNLDGVDIDWEYPGLPGDNNTYRPEDRENFTALMKGLREAFDATGRKLDLSFAAAGWHGFFDHIETLEVMKYASYINLMTYDYATGGTPYTRHHTNLGNVTEAAIAGTPMLEIVRESNGDSGEGQVLFRDSGTREIVRYCRELGVDPSQIVIGAAFYGRGWVGVPPDNHGLYQSVRGPYRGNLSYSLIRSEVEASRSFSRYWDPAAEAPWLYNAADSIFISYDDTMSVRLKAAYCIEEQLGGIMFWQLSGDTEEHPGLLDVITGTLK